MQKGNQDLRPSEVSQLGDEAWKGGKYNEARTFYEKAAAAYSKLEDDQGEALVLARVGELELSLNSYNFAEKALLSAMELVKNLEDAENTYADILLKLAKLKSQEGNVIDALSYVRKSKKIAESIGNNDFIGNSYDLEALIYLQDNKEKDALKAYESAAIFHEKSKITLKEAATLRAIARLEIKNKNYDKAHDVLEKCRDLYRENGDLLGEASALSAIGSLRYIIRDIINARKALMKSVYLYGKVSHHFAEAEALLYLARVEGYNRELGDFDRAKTHYKRSIELFDFLDNETMKEAVLSEYYIFLKRIGE